MKKALSSEIKEVVVVQFDENLLCQVIEQEGYKLTVKAHDGDIRLFVLSGELVWFKEGDFLIIEGESISVLTEEEANLFSKIVDVYGEIDDRLLRPKVEDDNNRE